MPTHTRYAPPQLATEVVRRSVEQAVSFSTPVVLADSSATQPTLPNIVVSNVSCIETVAPGSGIFDAEVEIKYSSHTKLTKSEERDDIIKSIYDLAYDKDTPIAERLSRQPNFTCYGWVDKGNRMEVDPDTDAYHHIQRWMIVFTPTD